MKVTYDCETDTLTIVFWNRLLLKAMRTNPV